MIGRELINSYKKSVEAGKAENIDTEKSDIPVISAADARPKPGWRESEVRGEFLKAMQIGNYSLSTMIQAEQLFRLETRNFTSGQWKTCLSPGMHAHDETYPYGWSTPVVGWKKSPRSNRPDGMVVFTENKSIRDVEPMRIAYLSFSETITCILGVCEYIEKYGPFRWFGIEENDQTAYMNAMKNYPSKFFQFS